MNENDVRFQYSVDAHLWHYPEEPLNFVPEKQTDEAENIVQEENVDNVDKQDIGVQDVDEQETEIQGVKIQSTDVQSTLDQGNQGTAAMNVDEIGMFFVLE